MTNNFTSDTLEVQKNHVFDSEKLKIYLINLNLFESSSREQSSLSIKQFVHGQSNPTFLIDFNGIKFVFKKKTSWQFIKKRASNR